MKKGIILFLLSVSLFMYSNDCYGQFLKRLSKGIENVSKKLDNALKTEESADNQPKMTVSTPHKNLKVSLLSAEMTGGKFILEFTITNIGEDIKDYRLTGCFGGCGNTKAYDNLGNECRVDIIFGTSESWHGGTAGSSLFKDVPTKVKVILSQFSSEATLFSQIRIKGGAWDHGMTNRPDGDFIFKNVPIVKNEETEVVIPVKDASAGNSPVKDITTNNDPMQTETQRQTSQTLNIPDGKFGMINWSATDRTKYIKAKRITSQERLALKIDNVKDDILNKNLRNSELVWRRTVYRGQKGHIESVIIIYDYPREGQEFYEYLISYDTSENYISHLQVGCEKLYYTNDVSAILKGGVVTVTNYYADAGEEETIVTKYIISPNLKFNLIN